MSKFDKSFLIKFYPWIIFFILLVLYSISVVVSDYSDSVYSFEEALSFLHLIKTVPLILAMMLIFFHKRPLTFIWKIISIYFVILLLLLPIHFYYISKIFNVVESSYLMGENLKQSILGIERIFLIPILILFIHYSFTKKSLTDFIDKLEVSKKMGRIYSFTLLVSLIVSIVFFSIHSNKTAILKLKDPLSYDIVKSFLIDCSKANTEKIKSSEMYRESLDNNVLLDFVEEFCTCLGTELKADKIFDKTETPNITWNQFIKESFKLKEVLESDRGKILVSGCIQKTGVFKNVTKK